jgi:hypothetical protein
VKLTNEQVLAGAGGSMARAYRTLVTSVDGGHNALCDAYGLDRDDVHGGTWWPEVLEQALRHGDVDPETLNPT